MSLTRAAWVDDHALAVFPGLERALSTSACVTVMRCFASLPNPSSVARCMSSYKQIAVIGGRDATDLLRRLELASATLRVPVVVALPTGVKEGAIPRLPGVVDVLSGSATDAARRIALMVEVPVVSWGRTATPALTAPPSARTPALTPLPTPGTIGASVIGIVGSTGAAHLLAQILRVFATTSSTPVLVAQHMDKDFVVHFGEWLASMTGLPVEIVGAAVPLAPRRIYVSRGGEDLVLLPNLRVESLAPVSRYVPNGDRMLRSMAEVLGARALGVVLSGMGSDGAQGASAIRRAGGTVVCQTPSTAVVSSMPESALREAPGAPHLGDADSFAAYLSAAVAASS